jgi:hypothetical protein
LGSFILEGERGRRGDREKIKTLPGHKSNLKALISIYLKRR